MDKFTRRVLLAGTLGFVLLLFAVGQFVMPRLMRNATDAAEEITSSFYERELRGEDGMAVMNPNSEAQSEYRQHVNEAGKVLSFKITKSYAQILGTSAHCEVLVHRERGVYEEYWRFHHRKGAWEGRPKKIHSPAQMPRIK